MNQRLHLLLTWVILLLPFSASTTPLRAEESSSAGHLVHGSVRDVEHGEGLSAATIQIVGTYRGTIANDAGDFTLEIPLPLPATLLVTRIGYSSREFVVADSSVTEIDFRLEVSPHTLPELFVTPALGRDIMRQVIDRKRQWMPRIQDYRAEAYTRRTFSKSEEVILVQEIVSEVLWDQEHGEREIVTSMRQTRNMDELEQGGLSAVEGVINLYHDDVRIVEHQVIGPTHPNALESYDFRVEALRLVDDTVVYDISVRPTTLQPSFVGTISILDGDFALLEADLRLSRSTLATLLPVPLLEEFGLSYRQQFREFDDVWLPVDYHVAIDVTIGMIGLHFPAVTIEQATRFVDYDVNVDPPDSLFDSAEHVRFDSAAVAADSLFTRFPDPLPLTVREQAAYDTISVDYDTDRVLEPTGFLARFVIDEENEEKRAERRDEREGRIAIGSDGVDVSAAKSWWGRFGLAPGFRFNRVEGGQFMLARERGGPAGTWLKGVTGYSTGLERVSADIALRRPVASGLGFVELTYHRGSGSHYGSSVYPMIVNTAQALLAVDDYFDYYWVQGYGISTGIESGWPAPGHARLDWRDEDHSSLETQTDFNLLGGSDIARPNPPVDEGHMRRLDVTLGIGAAASRFGLQGRRAEVSLSYSDDWMGSDFDFALVHGEFTWRQPTFLKRRFIPNMLSLKGVAGTHSGTLPVQRFGSLDVAIGPLSPFGVLRGVRGHPYIGQRYVAAFWEHDFRTVPFELLRVWPLVERGFGLAVHGASGKTWIDAGRRANFVTIPRWTKETHHEIGTSLQLYYFGRIDLTRRLDRDEWLVGVSIVPFDFD